jgi:hypothetical protein
MNFFNIFYLRNLRIIKLVKANHSKGWDAKPLALIQGKERQQGCRAEAAPPMAASRLAFPTRCNQRRCFRVISISSS